MRMLGLPAPSSVRLGGLAVVFGLLASSLATEAQTGKVPTVVFVGPSPAPSGECANPPMEGPVAFQQGLRDLGYVIGQTIQVERRCYRTAEQLTAIVREFIDVKVDVIVAAAGDAMLAAHGATRTIPIVGLHADPVGAGLLQSLARPGGNATGMVPSPAEIYGKRLELLKALAPHVSRVAILVDPSFAPPARSQSEAAGRALGLHVRTLEVRVAEDLEPALETIRRERLDGISVQGGTVFFTKRQRLIEWTTQNRRPAIFWWRTFTDEGGLMSYAVNVADTYWRLAGYVDKILKGAKPGELPVEQPTKFELIINNKTVRALGLTIPSSLRLQADRIIE